MSPAKKVGKAWLQRPFLAVSTPNLTHLQSAGEKAAADEAAADAGLQDSLLDQLYLKGQGQHSCRRSCCVSTLATTY